MNFSAIRDGWKNAFYRGTICYVAVLVTIIFSLQIYRFFVTLPAEAVIEECPGVTQSNFRTLIPALGAFFDEKP